MDLPNPSAHQRAARLRSQAEAADSMADYLAAHGRDGLAASNRSRADRLYEQARAIEREAATAR